MKKSLTLLLGFVALAGSGCTGYVAAPAPAPGYYGTVVVADRPYYTHGPRYYSRGIYYRWVPGHYAHRNGHRVWIHGHYVQ